MLSHSIRIAKRQLQDAPVLLEVIKRIEGMDKNKPISLQAKREESMSYPCLLIQTGLGHSIELTEHLFGVQSCGVSVKVFYQVFASLRRDTEIKTSSIEIDITDWALAGYDSQEMDQEDLYRLLLTGESILTTEIIDEIIH